MSELHLDQRAIFKTPGLGLNWRLIGTVVVNLAVWTALCHGAAHLI